jgi:hypothetical protein
MFDLMTGTDVLPVLEDRIIQVHKGMNKLRVSVGEHVSEPSDVYIITGEEAGYLNSFIVFFMDEPGIHIVYGFEDNPYDPDLREEVLNMAVDFVEDMGAILEEIPWKEMTPEEQMNWIGKETLYPALDAEEIEEIETADLLEVIEKVDDGDETVDDLSGTGDDIDDIADVSEKPSSETDVPSEMIEEDSIEGDEDFEKLLKQAFLKPDLLIKSSSKKTATWKEEPGEDELPTAEEADLDLGEEEVEVAEPELPEAAEDGEHESVQTDTEGEVVSSGDLQPGPASMFQDTADKAPDSFNHTTVNSDEQTRLTVIKYLSRF